MVSGEKRMTTKREKAYQEWLEKEEKKVKIDQFTHLHLI